MWGTQVAGDLTKQYQAVKDKILYGGGSNVQADNMLCIILPISCVSTGDSLWSGAVAKKKAGGLTAGYPVTEACGRTSVTWSS